MHLEGPSKKWMSYFALVGGTGSWSITCHFILRPGMKTLWGFENVHEGQYRLDAGYKAFGLGRLFQVCWSGSKKKEKPAISKSN